MTIAIVGYVATDRVQRALCYAASQAGHNVVCLIGPGTEVLKELQVELEKGEIGLVVARPDYLEGVSRPKGVELVGPEHFLSV